MRGKAFGAGITAWALACVFALSTLICGALAFSSAAHAQGAGPDDFKQIKLTEAQVKGFIAADPDMAKISEKMQGSDTDKPDPAVQAELENIAKKHGFKDFAEYDDVAANVSVIWSRIDPQTGAYTDPIPMIKKEIEDINADKTLSDKDKKEQIDEREMALKNTQPIQFPDNIELVKKYRDDLDKMLH